MVAEGGDEVFLELGREVGEDLAGVVAREDAEGGSGLGRGHAREQLGDVGVGEVAKAVSERPPVLLLGEFADFGFDGFDGWAAHWWRA